MINRIKYDPKNKKRWLKLREELSGKNTPNLWRHGSSDVATIMGHNPYQSQREYFYHCIDWVDMTPHHSLPTYRGQIMEEPIFNNYWKYWNPDNPSNEAFLENVFGDKKVYRRGRLYNYTVLNDKYPYSYTNPDYQIYKNPYTPSGLVELKSVTYRSQAKYESGIAPMYLFQAYHQMMMLEIDYVEVFMLVDDTQPQLFPLEHNQNIIDQIIEAENDFGDLVMKGKKIVYNEDIPLFEKEHMISDIAPENDGSDNLTSFYTELHKLKESTASVEGTGEQLDKVLAYLEIKNEKIKPLEVEAKKLEQDIRGYFLNDIGEITFGELGSISYYGRINIPFRIYKNYHGE